jgi:hypothetical protein
MWQKINNIIHSFTQKDIRDYLANCHHFLYQLHDIDETIHFMPQNRQYIQQRINQYDDFFQESAFFCHLMTSEPDESLNIISWLHYNYSEKKDIDEFIACINIKQALNVQDNSTITTVMLIFVFHLLLLGNLARLNEFIRHLIIQRHELHPDNLQLLYYLIFTYQPHSLILSDINYQMMFSYLHQSNIFSDNDKKQLDYALIYEEFEKGLHSCIKNKSYYLFLQRIPLSIRADIGHYLDFFLFLKKMEKTFLYQTIQSQLLALSNEDDETISKI